MAGPREHSHQRDDMPRLDRFYQTSGSSRESRRKRAINDTEGVRLSTVALSGRPQLFDNLLLETTDELFRLMYSAAYSVFDVALIEHVDQLATASVGEKGPPKRQRRMGARLTCGLFRKRVLNCK